MILEFRHRIYVDRYLPNFIFKSIHNLQNVMMNKFSISILFLFISVLTYGQKLPFNFNAKGILALSDADMVASAYADGKLNSEAGINDMFSTITVGDNIQDIKVKNIHVPNSVTNWVNGMTISKDQKTAFVIDTRGSLPSKVQQVKNVFEDLPSGNTLYAIDISDLTNPKIVSKIAVGSTPLSVDVNPLNETILIACAEKGKELVLIEWKNKKFGKLNTHSFKGATEQKVTHANWHPSGKYLGITLENIKSVQFFKVPSNSEITALGNPVNINGLPGASAFSPNGKFYIVPNLNWDKGYNLNGELICVAFDENGGHKINSTATVGISPEGIAISPNGKYIASSNMGTNFFPLEFPIFGQKASISLLQFDQENGTMTVADTKEWDGILPEGIAFDKDSDMLVVTSFDYLDLSKRQGGLSFWQIITEDNNIKLKNTDFKLTLPRGTHYLKLID